ncbi:hypothetical protein TNCV_4829481 [Trichonephila clavipes]|nr:hypothetical protein TNCV_4829481 [Trichonephila clavipes]
MVHQHIFQLRCVTTSLVHITGGGMDATDQLFGHAPRPQPLGFLLLGPPETSCVRDTGGSAADTVSIMELFERV